MPRTKSGTFNQSKYIQQFMKEKVTVKKATFNKEADADLLAWLADKRFSTYVKELIREDMHVVRCKDCKYLIDHYGFMDDGYCENMRETYCLKFKPEDDWFCADGVHK